SSHVDTMQNTMSHAASSGSFSAILAPCFESGCALAGVRFHTVRSAPACASRAAISKPMRPVPIQPMRAGAPAAGLIALADAPGIVDGEQPSPIGLPPQDLDALTLQRNRDPVGSHPLELPTRSAQCKVAGKRQDLARQCHS